MMKMVLIKRLLVLLMIARTESQLIITKGDYSIGERIMRTILESCYAESSFHNPVVIFGKFNELIEGVSNIRINDFLNLKDYEQHRSLKFKASSVVLKEEHPQKLLPHLELLRRTKLWDNLVPFFIIGENTTPCTNSISILQAMWLMEILNLIYICPNSINDRPEIYTLNPITNYAPYPWKGIYKLGDLNVFRQNFNANIFCERLTYDKTKFLNGYNMIAVTAASPELHWISGTNYFKDFAEQTNTHSRAMRTIIIALNASGRIEVEIGVDSMKKRIQEGSADLVMMPSTLDSYWKHPYIFPLYQIEIVAVVKLGAEVSTLEKIRHLWSAPVLIAAVLAMAVLFLILMIKRWSFGSALLDVTRLLTYTSIQIDNRYQSFRIYFTTMLIFIVISNGVFQGKIAAFLTTRERSSAAESIHELVELGYQLYTPRELIHVAKWGCPECEFSGELNAYECIELALNSTQNLCVVPKEYYESECILLPLDRVRVPLYSALMSFKCREDWPLRDRFNDMMIKVVEAGLPDYWNMKATSIPKAKRQSREAEWASAQYRPVALKKLDFAFKLLAVGLFLATIVLYLELCWDKYVNL